VKVKVCLLFLIFLSLDVYAQACQLSVRIYPYQPLSYQTAEHRWQGLNIDFINELLPKINCSSKYIAIPFARSIKMLREGKVDVMLNVTKTPEREKYFSFIGPMRFETILLVTHRAMNTKISTLEDILNIKGEIGLRRGTYIGENFEQLMKNELGFSKKIVTISNTKQMITMFNKRKIVGFFEEELHFHYQKKNNLDYKDLVIQPVEVATEPVYIAFSKKSVPENLLAQLSVVNHQLINNGTYQKIIIHYLDETNKEKL